MKLFFLLQSLIVDIYVKLYILERGAKMPSSRKMILRHVMSGLCGKMNRTKQLPSDIMETPLNRCLNTFDITLLGTYMYLGIYLS